MSAGIDTGSVITRAVIIDGQEEEPQITAALGAAIFAEEYSE
jgi:activator of 2-hydroxyglutaryl-CoA dehydratase